jgi:hypothetical protein
MTLLGMIFGFLDVRGVEVGRRARIVQRAVGHVNVIVIAPMVVMLRVREVSC